MMCETPIFFYQCYEVGVDLVKCYKSSRSAGSADNMAVAAIYCMAVVALVLLHCLVMVILMLLLSLHFIR